MTSSAAISQGPRPARFRSAYPGELYLALWRDPLAYLARAARECGDFAQLHAGSRPHYLINHPDLIQQVLTAPGLLRSTPRALKPLLREGLLTSQGDVHRRQRRLLQPAFHRQRIAACADAITGKVAEQAAHWRDGAVLDVATEMTDLTMRVILKTMFSAEAEGELVDLAAGVTAFVEATHRGVLPIIYRSVQHWPLPPVRRLEAARHRLDTIMFRIIEQRRAATERPADFLTMLVEEQEGDGNDAGMSAEQVRDEAITIFATGHETTATALTWTWYLLSQHPGAEANLHGELATVLGGRAPTFADMPQLRLTEAIVSEALRLYPPVWVMARKTTEPYTLAGHTVPPNSYLHMSQYLVHRDARWFPDPERFDPARWTSEATTATRPKYSYFPFGGGPRQCIGEGLAWMELILTIATLAQQWRLRLVPGHRVEMAPLVTLRPRGGMPMLLERRETC